MNYATYTKMINYLILFGPKKLGVIRLSMVRGIIGQIANSQGCSTFDYLMDLKDKKIITQEQVDEILKQP